MLKSIGVSGRLNTVRYEIPGSGTSATMQYTVV